VISRNISNTILLLDDVRDLQSSWSGGSIFILLVGEDINADNSGFGWSMFSRLGCGVLGNFARESLQHTVSTLLDATGGSGNTVWGSSFNFLEISLIFWHLLNQKYYVGIKSNSFINTQTISLTNQSDKLRFLSALCIDLTEKWE
jgi:hypothetical protein